MKKNKPLNILLIGSPGSGKGTQAKILAKKYNLIHLQSGEILRKIASEDTKFGKEVHAAMQEGFVPSEWILKITKDEFKKIDKDRGIVLDSFSKLLPEIKMLYNILGQYGRKLDYIFLIKIDGEEVLRRLASRGACSSCKEIIAVKEIGEAVCSKCGGKIYMRKDDNFDSIKKRIEDYKNKTSKVIDYIKKNDKLIEINGKQTVENVFQDIIKNIN